MSWRFKFFLVLYGLLLTGLALRAQNFGGDFDVLFHYWIAELAWSEPHWLLDLWGKPLFTGLMVLPIQMLGYTGVMLVNGLLLFLALFCLDRVAKAEGWRYRWLIWLLPLLLRTFLSYQFRALTEPVAGAMIVFAGYALYRQKWLFFYLLASALYLIRYELIFLLPLAALFALQRRDLRGLWLLAVPLSYEVLAHFILGQAWGFSLTGGYKTGASVYGSGAWDHFIQKAYSMTGSAFLLVLLGLSALAWAAVDLKRWWQQRLRVIHYLTLFLSAAALGVFLLHSSVWALGVYASAGMERVLHPIFLPLVFLFLAALNRLNSVWGVPLIITVLGLQLHSLFWEAPKLTEHYLKSIFWPHPVQGAMTLPIWEGVEKPVYVNDAALAFYLGQNLEERPEYWQSAEDCLRLASEQQQGAVLWFKKEGSGPSVPSGFQSHIHQLPYGQSVWLIFPRFPQHH